ncbi:CRISPR-associated helicase/endonuclease Cas3 [Treponema primitia]|uniref:CRISPR-associated helicase/endonuclease Cas3 n=1 Tax=Treponema primitia TaxID=88058 RepID=UPI00025558BE|nr:CRISPR-associated helicase/endonuclease Cas3 [Treponema primitia]
MDFIAHVRKLLNEQWAKPQSLNEHLQGTAELAAEFAKSFDSAEWAYVLGMSHDTGKGTVEWQRYICNKSGYDEEASSESPGRLEHSGAGAKLVEESFDRGTGRILSYCVAGHHAGLADYIGSPSALVNRLQQVKTDKIAEEFKFPLSSLKPQKSPWKFKPQELDASLWIRMLFSCLVDADRLDTENYMDSEKSASRKGYRSITELQQRFNNYMEGKAKSLGRNLRLYEARQRVLSDCRAAAVWQSGFFSLTVPTGGGKTLSSMAFALKHAEQYKKDRVIYVIPYTSIIEQNADVFREVFGDDELVEHHSSLAEEDSTIRGRLASENWDAPIIITTAVQFFESLFANKAGRCRKIHNIANSVIVLDEAQLIPTDFLAPILETLRLLVEHYRVSVVICTATKPALEKQQAFLQFPGLPKDSIREIIHDVPDLFGRLERVKVTMPPDQSTITEWKELSEELSAYKQVLCIVSDRKSCRELHALMPKGTYHLSALMCAQHRSDVIKKIKEKLAAGKAIRVISTQLVEAGVDIDFPVVYRAMAGLDSIAQAAGRCNREGKLNAADELGKVVVFNAPRKPPPGTLRKASETAQRMCKEGLNNPLDPSVFLPYFSELFWKSNSLDARGIMKYLVSSRFEFQFKSAAEQFKIIDDKNQMSVLVPYGEGGKFIDLLKNIKNGSSFENILLRKLQRYSVNVYNYQYTVLQGRGSLEKIVPGVFALTTTIEYDPTIGLLIDEMPNNPEDFII